MFKLNDDLKNLNFQTSMGDSDVEIVTDVQKINIQVQLISYKRYLSVYSFNGDYLSFPKCTGSCAGGGGFQR